MAQKAQKINILEMHASFGYAGGPKNLVTFCKFLNKDIFNVFACAHREGGVQEQHLEKLGIPYLLANGDIQKIQTFFQEKHIDVLHIHRSGHAVPIETAIMKAARAVNPNVLILEKNVFGKHDVVSGELVDCSFFQSMMHLNERYLPAASEPFNFENHKVLYNMVDSDDVESYRLSKKEIAAYKKSLGIPSDHFVLGKIGRPHVAKWSDLILDMMPTLVRHMPNVTFLIQSLPPSRKKRVAHAPWAKQVIDIPQSRDLRDVHRFYQTIDVLAHASKIGECNGNTINEALYWKKPVVTNSTPRRDNGQLEQVLHMKNGIIANDPASFAKAIVYLANHPQEREKMGCIGYEQVTSVNRPEQIVGMLEKTIYEHAKKKRLPYTQLFDEERMNGITYTPSVDDIQTYKKTEYHKRLQVSFACATLFERILVYVRIPRKLYWKVRDYIEVNML